MKKILLASLIATAFGASTSAFAGNTQTMAVSATITGTCKLQSSTAMAFGSIDPSSLTAASASAAVTYKCTNGTAPTSLTAVGANDSAGQKRMLTGASTFMNYSIAFTAPTTAGTGFGPLTTATTVSVTGTVAVADFANAAAGAYADTLTFTIAP